jgi:hypothetical protein
MWVFGYNYDHKKLDPRCIKGIFIGHDKNSPACLVYHPQCGKILKHRLIKDIEHRTIFLERLRMKLQMTFRNRRKSS